MNSLENFEPGQPTAAERSIRPPRGHEHALVARRDLDIAAACFSLLRIVTMHDRDMARRYGVTPQQYEAMLEIHFCDGPELITIGGLARRLNIKHNSVVGVVNKLASRRLVMRTPSERDRRLMHLSLTEQGRNLLQALASADRDLSGKAAAETMR